MGTCVIVLPYIKEIELNWRQIGPTISKNVVSKIRDSQAAVTLEACRSPKISNSIGRIGNFRVLARKLSFLPTELDISNIGQYYLRIVFIFQSLIC